MKVLYLDCSMGAAGDMLTAALLELLPEPDRFLEKLRALAIPHVRFKAERTEKCGITGTHMSVTVHGVEEEAAMAHTHGPGGEAHSHPHGSMHEIEHLVKDHLKLPDRVAEDVLAVYGLIAQAESQVHGVPVTDIHFHEVGTMDALADITAVCLLMRELAPDEVIASPVHVGSGQVKCAHGILPVPAPATAFLLRDIPIYGGEIRGELCTPTGAALLRHFVTRFGGMPVMKPRAIGYGMGKRDFPAANCVRAILGDGAAEQTDQVVELACNVDDMTAEAVGFATEELFAGGALDVCTLPIGMKKNRPGTLISVLCRPEEREKLVWLLFRHTTTLGVRETISRRYVLARRTETLQTPYGTVRRKHASGYGVERVKYEYDDLSRLARERGISLEAAQALLAGNSGAERDK